eukprot:Selendium_serpulae@DN6311_c1_g3_i1.p1
MHPLELSEVVKKHVEEKGLVGYRFNTVGVSDGMSMGTSGMSYSLPSRDLIADSVETTMSSQWYDGCIALPGCDKNMPGVMIGIARLDRPAIVIYGGTIRAGKSSAGETIDIVSAFQSYGEYLSGSITDAQRQDVLCHACPGPGACGGMYTANTMGVAIEAMGMSLPYSSSNPATSDNKRQECAEAAAAIRRLIVDDLTPSKILTRKAFENAIRAVMALGGSTNAVLHLLAMAKAVQPNGITPPITLDDFQRMSDSTPQIANLKPSGKYVMEDIHRIGGTPAVLKHLLDVGLLHADCLTVTGRTLGENLKTAKSLDFSSQDVIHHAENNPLHPQGHIKILRGNLAPDGAVAKLTGDEGTHFRGPANVFDSEEEMLSAMERKAITKGEVIVIRYEGPKGGPGMPEMLTPTAAVMGAGLGKDVALLTDGRFSGGSHQSGGSGRRATSPREERRRHRNHRRGSDSRVGTAGGR